MAKKVTTKKAEKVGAAKAETPSRPRKEPGRADVFYGTGQVRTYWEDVHGPDYKKFAEEFAKKFGGRVL
jgi:hypothetical protein